MKRFLVFAAVAVLGSACVGPQGPAGPQGPPGMTGAQGASGMTGSTGQTGMTGSPGQTGMTGSQGEPGLTGSPASVASAPGPSSSSLREILFDYRTAEIRPSEMTKISEVAVYVSQNPNINLGLGGATDLLQGSNQLSDQRVANVREALIERGVPASRIESGQFAAERPVCSDSAKACAMRDARVEILALPSS